MRGNFRGKPSEADKKIARTYAAFLKLKSEHDGDGHKMVMAAAQEATLVLTPHRMDHLLWKILESIESAKTHAADLAGKKIPRSLSRPDHLGADILGHAYQNAGKQKIVNRKPGSAS